MVGQVVGKYQVLERIGRGGMGTVYRAKDETLHREVAIKVLNAELNDPEIARRFRAEAVTVARLNHPGIATIFELFEHDGQWLMVMEFVRGETLEKLVTRTGALSPQRAAEICMQTLTALAHAHSLGVIHRDLKPANLMLTDTGAVKIMDFGIARVSGTEHMTNAGFMMGTPAYMAPEQVLGNEVDARADLYAIGCVFYRLTTGKLPFRGETPFAMAQSQLHDPPTPIGTQRSDLPAWADQITVRALAKGLEERFQSAVEFYEAFSRCLAGLPMTTLYNPSAPTELLTTPARAIPMPTGAISQTAGFGSSIGSPLQPAVRTPLPGTAQIGTGIPSAAITPGPTSPVGPQMATPAQATGAVATPPRRSNVALLVIAGVGLLVVIGGFAMWMRSREQAAQPAPGTQTAAPAAATEPAPPPATPDQPPATTTPATTLAGAPGASAGAQPPVVAANDPSRGAGARAATPATTPAGVPAGAAPGSAGARGDAAAAGTVPNPTDTRPPLPAGADEHIMFSSVKMLSVNGKKSADQDVVVNFVGGQVSITAKSGGAAIASMGYRAIVKATYVHAKNPAYDPTLTAVPPEGLELPGGIFGRPTRHWLVLQTKTEYRILRLEDSNFQRILETIEARTGIKVDRPAGDKDE